MNTCTGYEYKKIADISGFCPDSENKKKPGFLKFWKSGNRAVF